MPRYLCEAQCLVEKYFDAEDEETAEMLMGNYMTEEHADLDWVISSYEDNEKCWHLRGCRFNSNTSSGYLKCRQQNYSVAMCKMDYIR